MFDMGFWSWFYFLSFFHILASMLYTCFFIAGGLCAELKEHTAETTNGVVKTIANVLLQRVSGTALDVMCML